MKKILVYISTISVVIFCLSGSASADKTIRYRDAKTLGLGDARIAGGFGYNGFLDNPALLSRVGILRLSIVNLPIMLNKNLLDIAKFINDNNENFKNYDELSYDEKEVFVNNLNEHDSKWGRIALSPLVGISTNIKGFGVGLAGFITGDVALKMDRGIYEPRVWGEGYSNAAVVLGFAKPVSILYPGLTVGVNLKYMERRHVSLFQIPASDLGNITDTTKPIIDEFKNEKQRTFAVDVGTLWDIPFINSEVGATVQSIGDGKGSSIDLGIAKRMLSNRLILLTDYIDFLDSNKENIFRKIHIGAQYKFAIFALRAGLNSGYPTFGFGLNTRIIDIDYAYYSEELSKSPGVFEENRHTVQFKLGF